MPPLRLDEEAKSILENYRWPGNIRQLKNIAEQISIIEGNRMVNAETLKKYLPDLNTSSLPVLFSETQAQDENFSERELLFSV